MDPLADKLLITAALISLVQMGLASAWMVAVILGRELGVTVLRTMVRRNDVPVLSFFRAGGFVGGSFAQLECDLDPNEPEGTT